jgi:hypothetical protein
VGAPSSAGWPAWGGSSSWRSEDALDLTADPVVLDPELPSEQVPKVAGFLVLFLLVGVPMAAEGYPAAFVGKVAAHLVLAGVGLLVLWKTRSLDYVLDPTARSVVFRKRLLGRESRRQVCSFDDVAAVAVECRRFQTKHRSWFEYRLVLVTKAGEVVPLTEDSHDHVGADREAARLAEFLGCDVVGAREGARLSVDARPGEEPTVFQEGVEGQLVPYGGQAVVGPSLGLALVVALASVGLAWVY